MSAGSRRPSRSRARSQVQTRCPRASRVNLIARDVGQSRERRTKLLVRRDAGHGPEHRAALAAVGHYLASIDERRGIPARATEDVVAVPIAVRIADAAAAASELLARLRPIVEMGPIEGGRIDHVGATGTVQRGRVVERLANEEFVDAVVVGVAEIGERGTGSSLVLVPVARGVDLGVRGCSGDPRDERSSDDSSE